MTGRDVRNTELSRNGLLGDRRDLLEADFWTTPLTVRTGGYKVRFARHSGMIRRISARPEKSFAEEEPRSADCKM
jgi:hypothetical protein